MPTVIGINQVPYGIPPQPGFWGNLGQLYGTQTRQVTDALLHALLQNQALGQVPTTPTSQNPGTFNFPPGSQSPLEAQQIAALGGVPTNAGVMARATQQPSTAGVQYVPPTKLGITPSMDFLKKQQELELNQKLGRYYDSITKGTSTDTSGISGGGTPGGTFVDALKKLAPLADDSNPDPVSKAKARERIALFRQLAEAPL